MKKAFKIIGKVFLGLLILIVLFVVIMTIYNQIMLKKNKDLYETPLGQLVDIDGHNMSIYTEGKGEHTIVFMSGWDTVSPILDFKPLYSRLSDDYRCVVIEKFGYGFSDIVDGERDFDTILRQDREALKKAGIEAPYVLCPHSLSGFEATLWAQKYPDEVEAIVGLDMSTANYPELAEMKDSFSQKAAICINKALRATGVLRLMDFDISGTLSEQEKKIYTEIACHKDTNENIVSENENIGAVILEINSAALPETPTLQFLSGDNKNDELWYSTHKEYADASTRGEIVQLECGHYVHDFEYERISKDIKEFIEKDNG